MKLETILTVAVSASLAGGTACIKTVEEPVSGVLPCEHAIRTPSGNAVFQKPASLAPYEDARESFARMGNRPSWLMGHRAAISARE